MPQCNERIPCWLRPRAGRWQSTQAGISDKKVAMLVTMLRVLVRFALMQLLPMLWFRSQASLAASTMTGATSSAFGVIKSFQTYRVTDMTHSSARANGDQQTRVSVRAISTSTLRG